MVAPAIYDLFGRKTHSLKEFVRNPRKEKKKNRDRKCNCMEGYQSKPSAAGQECGIGGGGFGAAEKRRRRHVGSDRGRL